MDFKKKLQEWDDAAEKLAKEWEEKHPSLPGPEVVEVSRSEQESETKWLYG